MGRNEWRDEEEWPLARTAYTPYYFDSGGSANTLDGDGSLRMEKAGGAATDTFVYDPADPVPTLGGNVLFGTHYGSFDHSEVEEREDVLVFTTEALEVKSRLPVGSRWCCMRRALRRRRISQGNCWMCTRTVARLICVMGLFVRGGGMLRVSRRLSCPRCLSVWDRPLGAEQCFLAGHRIRVEISSSNFPRLNRNLNTGNAFATNTEIETATQMIYHDVEYASHILLPIIAE